MGCDSIEEKLTALENCGFTLATQFTLDDLVASWGREALDEPGFELALVCLGMTEEAPPWRPHCINLWHFDAECIDGAGSYVQIAERIAAMAQGSLPLSEIQDHVDLGEGSACLRFRFRDRSVRIECTVQDDWVDFSVFSQLATLLQQSDPDKLLFSYDLRAQDCILGCARHVEFEKLKRLIPSVSPIVPASSD